MSLPLQATPPTRRSAPGAEFYRVAGRDWPLVLKRHPRARRISLRVRAPDRTHTMPQIVLTLPKRSALAQAMQFLQANTVWLARELSRHQIAEKAADGTELSVLGEPLIFRHTGQLRGLPKQEENILWLSGTPERFGARMEAYLSQRLESFAQAESERFAALLNVTVGRIHAKRMQSRWGSCSPDGDIALNWRLALAPEEVARYVVAHELAHRREMNHSPAFWACVRFLMPEFPAAREWLKREGHTLYRCQM